VLALKAPAHSAAVTDGGLSMPDVTIRRRLDGGYTVGLAGRGLVELTPQGARLLEEARRVTGQLERTVHELRGMGTGAHARLRIGYVSLADYGVLPGLLKAYKNAQPGVRLALREMLSPDQAAALAAGELDFGLLLPPVAGAARLEHLVVQRERFVLALPAKHRLAGGNRAYMNGRLTVRPEGRIKPIMPVRGCTDDASALL